MLGRIPAEVFPPGEFLRDEIEARSLTPAGLAQSLGLPLQIVSGLLTGEQPITQDLADKLGGLFEVDPQFWMNLENAYRPPQIFREEQELAQGANSQLARTRDTD